jgi:hypothetical protein
MTHAQPEHRFRFVSAAQSLPYARAYALWIKNGEVGPQPVASTAEMRATVYDQAESASELRAFPKVAAIAGVELAEATLAGLRAGHIIITYTALRGLIERTAHAFATAAKLGKIKNAPVDGPLGPVLELSGTIHKALYATQREWTKLVNSDFRKTSVKDVQYVKKPNVANALPDNILNAIDKLDNAVAGTRLAYEILCEYLHPNVGDLWGATLEAESLFDAHGTRHLTRRIGLGPKSYKGLADLQVIRDKLFDVCGDMVAPLLGSKITSLWTMSAWTLLPVVLLSSPLVSLSHRAVVAIIAVALAVPLLMTAAAPAIAIYVHRVDAVTPAAAQSRLLAERVAQEWRKVTDQPLRLIGGNGELVYGLAFYSPGRPSAFPDFDLSTAPWVNPARIILQGIAIVCYASDPTCLATAEALGLTGRRIEVRIAREHFGEIGQAGDYVIMIVPPRP